MKRRTCFSPFPSSHLSLADDKHLFFPSLHLCTHSAPRNSNCDVDTYIHTLPTYFYVALAAPTEQPCTLHMYSLLPSLRLAPQNNLVGLARSAA